MSLYNLQRASQGSGCIRVYLAGMCCVDNNTICLSATLEHSPTSVSFQKPILGCPWFQLAIREGGKKREGGGERERKTEKEKVERGR